MRGINFPANPVLGQTVTGGNGGYMWDGRSWAAQSVQVAQTVVTTGGTVSYTPAPPAVSQWGQALAVTAGATATLASISSSAAGYQITGFTASGLGEGYFFIQVASLTVLSGRIRAAAPVYSLTLPNGMAVPAGSTVVLKVTNESGATTDFEATMLGA